MRIEDVVEVDEFGVEAGHIFLILCIANILEHFVQQNAFKLKASVAS